MRCAEPTNQGSHRVEPVASYREVGAVADTLRRAFVRHVGVTPAEYRKRYVSG
jgi:AraC-like DNA-binding protein